MGIGYIIRKIRLAFISIFIFLLFFIVTSGVWAEDASGQPATGNQVQSPFKDLGTDNYYFPYAKFLYNRQIITGFPDNTFRLNEVLTRAQVAVTLVKAMGLKDTPDSPDQALFVDIDQSHWAYKQIQLAAQAGILKGYPNGNFSPNEYITRAEAAVLFFRFAKESAEHFNYINIADVPADHWAYKYVEASVDGNFLGMFDKNKFSPDKSLTRAEWARGLSLVINLSPTLGQAPLTAVLLVKKTGVEIKTGDKIIVPKQDQKINLKINDQITTKTGIAEIQFPDGTGFKLESNTEIILKNKKGLSYMLPDGTQKVGVDYLELKLTEGKLLGSLATRYNLKQELTDKEKSLAFHKDRQVMIASLQSLSELLADNTEQQELPWYKTTTTKRVRVKVDMPWGVAAISGTTIYMEVKPDGQSIVSCYHGQVTVQSGAGGEVVVEQGKTTTIVSEGQPPEAPREQTPEEKQELVKNIEWFNQRIEQQIINRPLEINQPPPTQETQQEPGTEQPQEQLNQQQSEEELKDAIKSIVNDTLSNIGATAPSGGEQEQASSTNPGQGGSSGGDDSGGSQPIKVVPMANQTIIVGEEVLSVDLTDVFIASDGELLSYIMDIGGDPDTVNVSVYGSILTVDPVKPGIYPITIMAKDTNNNSEIITIYATAISKPLINPDGSVVVEANFNLTTGEPVTIDLAKILASNFQISGDNRTATFIGRVDVNLGSGMTVSFPSGTTALSSASLGPLQVKTVNEPLLPSPDGQQVFSFSFGSASVTFDKPITISLSVANPQAKAYYLNKINGWWEYLPNSIWDNSVLAFQTMHFSDFTTAVPSVGKIVFTRTGGSNTLTLTAPSADKILYYFADREPGVFDYNSPNIRTIIGNTGQTYPITADGYIAAVFIEKDTMSQMFKEKTASLEKSAEQVAAEITSIPMPAVNATRVTLPEVPEGFTISIKESSDIGIITVDGTVNPPKEAKTVELVLLVTRLSDNSTAETGRLAVAVPAKEPTEPTSVEIAASITGITAPAVNATRITLPDMPEGFTVSIKESSDSAIIALDGTIYPPTEAKTVELVLQVTRMSDNSTAETGKLAVEVSAKEPTAAEIAASITGITAPVVNDTRITLPQVPDGFTVSIKESSDNGIITLDGTVNPPTEAKTVELVLQVTRMSDNSTAETGKLVVEVPAKEPTVAEIAASITGIAAPTVNDTRITLPQVPDGFTVSIKETNDSRIITVDGAVYLPTEAKTVELVLLVTRLSDNSTAETGKLTVEVPAKEPTAEEIAASITGITAPAVNANRIILPEVLEGFTVSIKESSDSAIIALDGTIYPPTEAKTVELVLQVTRLSDNSTAETGKLAVEVPAKEPTAAEIAASITGITAPAVNANRIILPEVPEGFTVSMKESSDSAIIALDGTIYPPTEAKTVELVLQVTRLSDNSTAETGKLAVEVPAKEPTAAEIAASITGITSPAVNANRITLPEVPEGFTLSIKESSDNGIITLDGTVNPPTEAKTVELVLLVTRLSDNSTAETDRLAVDVPAKEPTAEEIAASITGIAAPTVNDTRITLPQVPDGFTVSIKETNDSRIITVDGAVYLPKEAKTVELVLLVTRLSDNSTAETGKLAVEVPAKEPTAAEIAVSITGITAPAVNANRIILPEVPEGFTVSIKESSDSAIIALDGTIYPPTEAKTVELVLQVTRLSDNSTAETGKLAVEVPAKEPTAAEIAASITGITAPAVNANRITLPEVPEGFTLSIKESSDNGIITLDGTVNPPTEAKTVELVLLVTRLSDNSTAETDRLAVDVPAKEPTAEEIAASITGITAPAVNANRIILPEVLEGFTVSIKESSDSAIIALDGTIYPSIEAKTVELVLLVTRLSDNSTAETGRLAIEVPASMPQVIMVSVINGTTVEVTFDNAVTTVDKSDFAFDNGLTVLAATIKTVSDNKIVVLTTGAQVANTTYTLSYKGDVTGKSFVGIVAVAGVALDQTTLNLTAGGTPVTLTETVTPVDATNKNVTWSSDNELVSTVVNGVVTPVAAGTATITVKTVNGGYTATCTVTVNQVIVTPPPVNSTISPTSATFDHYSDLVVTMNLNGNTLVSLQNGSTTLIKDTGNGGDYTVSGSNVNIKKECLATQSVGITTLTFNFNVGNPTILSITILPGFGGRVTNVNGTSVSEITIIFKDTLGVEVGSVSTDSNGEYHVYLQPGTYIGELSKEGYLTTTFVAVSSPDVYNTNQNAIAINVPEANETRIILTWNQSPSDLDSHLVGPTPDGGTFHIFFENKDVTVNGVVYDCLDHDCTTSYGPETTTIYYNVQGTYRFYVQQFSNTGSLGTSGAKVDVYMGDTTSPIKTYNVPTGSGEERYWAVFNLVVDGNGEVLFEDINQLVNSPPGPTITSSQPVISGTVRAGDISVSGTAVADASVVLSVNGLAQSPVIATDGSWTVTGLTLAEGDIISVTAQSAGEAESTAATTTVAAAWTATWAAVGGHGRPSTAYSLTTVNGTLYAGTVGVRKWDGSSWSAVGRLSSGAANVYSLATVNGTVYAGTKSGVWQWDGSSWSGVGSLSGADDVYSLTTVSGTVYAGTDSGVWQWDGLSWSELGSLSGHAAYVSSLIIVDGTVYAGTYGGGVWQWDGSSWSAVGSLSGVAYVRSLTTDNGTLYAGTVGSGVWQWDGSSWSELGSLSGYAACVGSLTSVNGTLYAGTVGGVWQWDGSSWSAVGSLLGQAACVLSLTTVNGTVYAGTVGGVWSLSLP